MTDGVALSGQDLPDDAESPTAAARYAEYRELAARILDPMERQVFELMRPEAKRTSADVEALLGIPASSVRNYWGRAVRKLVEALTQEGDRGRRGRR